MVVIILRWSFMCMRTSIVASHIFLSHRMQDQQYFMSFSGQSHATLCVPVK